MSKITFELLQDSNLEQCKTLCDELMQFQQSKAVIHPEYFDTMSFETRMKPAYENAKYKHGVIVKDGDIPIGYTFATISTVTKETLDFWPAGMPETKDSTGFYPETLPVPQKIGSINNIYLREDYKGQGLGGKLFDMSMQWIRGFSDVTLMFIYISNGNTQAYDFYLRKGFKPSHDVFGGFIKAVYYDCNERS
jgi:Acetyltransferases